MGETTDDPGTFGVTLVPFRSALAAPLVVQDSVELAPQAIVVGFALMPALGCASAGVQNRAVVISKNRTADLLDPLRDTFARPNR